MFKMQPFEDEVDLPKPEVHDYPQEFVRDIVIASPDNIQKIERQDYMKKVYGIVTLQLVITFGMTYLASCFQGFGAFCSHPATVIVSFIVLLGTMIASMFLSHQVPYNYLALFGFTVSMGMIASGCAAEIDSNSVLLAIFSTILMSVALTLYVWNAGAQGVVLPLFIIIVGTFLVEFVMIAFVFTRSEYLFAFCCSVIALIYGCYLVVHTHVIKEHSEVDDYIVSAMIIYLDIIRIFLYILAAMSKKK
eukprot:TRINITY_DN11097_c0_g2_i10.p1 TRINITY_DN11097_c0_g2~~TRINITY_DN11097_c0_g2_i10.p1  ORF type:complete len:248 (+),score=51.96 TRINITY_DN11097_c0_g2_i10:116-859(+)